MSVLVWGIKASLLAYVNGMPDGRVELAEVEEQGGRFHFAQDREADRADPAVRHFAGAVTLVGHHGLMRVVLADPWLRPTASGAALSVADPDVVGARLAFARIERWAEGVASGTTLTSEGADLFFGPYAEGTELDDPRVVD